MTTDSVNLLDGEKVSGDHVVLDTEEEDGERKFQDLVIKFSNLKTLLEPGAGRFGSAHPDDICHKIGNDVTKYTLSSLLSTNRFCT